MVVLGYCNKRSLNTAKYYMGTRLNTSCQAGQADFVQTVIVTSNSHAM